jgi:hypothetical protein
MSIARDADADEDGVSIADQQLIDIDGLIDEAAAEEHRDSFSTLQERTAGEDVLLSGRHGPDLHGLRQMQRMTLRVHSTIGGQWDHVGRNDEVLGLWEWLRLAQRHFLFCGHRKLL